MQQVVVIHGGDAFETHEEYIQSLRDKEVSLERLRMRNWKGTLREELGKEYDVLTPRMPNAQNARFAEWKIFFDKLVHLLEDNVIFIGHSLGGIFLAKYLSENKYPGKIKATFLIAAPFNTRMRHPLVDFNLVKSLSKFREQGGRIFLYHSKDDKVVHFANAKFYKKELPHAEIRAFEKYGHFNMEYFPELVTEIKTLV